MDALAGLFRAPAQGAGVALLTTGTVTAWNATTYANTITAATGIAYVNLPVLSPVGISVGIIVLLISSPGGPIILGRLYVP